MTTPTSTKHPAARQPAGWASVDVETTGLVAGIHQIWEVAIVLDDGTEWATMIEDVRLSNADPQALQIGRFWQRWDVVDPDPAKRTAVSAAKTVAQTLAGRVLVGSNPAFDARFLEQLLRGANRAPSWHYSVVDIKAMAAGWLHGRDDELQPTILPWSSYALSEACGISPPSHEERHTALGDSRWAARLYRHLTGEVDRLVALQEVPS